MFEKENTVFKDSKDRQVKHCYPNKKAATTDNYKFSLRSRCRKGYGLGRNGSQSYDLSLKCQGATQGTINSVISTLNQPIQVTYSLMLITWHIFPVSLIFLNSDRTPLCFHGPTHPTETTLGVLFIMDLCSLGNLVPKLFSFYNMAVAYGKTRRTWEEVDLLGSVGAKQSI